MKVIMKIKLNRAEKKQKRICVTSEKENDLSKGYNRQKSLKNLQVL